jgi:hypothetical protein
LQELCHAKEETTSVLAACASLILVVSMSATAGCPADFNNDGAVGITDFLDLLSHWGEANAHTDLNKDGVVDVVDFLDLLANWRPCP